MRRILFFGLALILFGCNSITKEKNEFKGKIDDIRLYSRELTDSEIKEISNLKH